MSDTSSATPDEPRTPNPAGVHVAHCWGTHGCKYAAPDCPVASGSLAQGFPCERCPDPDLVARLLPAPELLRERIGILVETRGFCECGRALRQRPDGPLIHSDAGPGEDPLLCEPIEPDSPVAVFEPSEVRTEIRASSSSITAHVEVRESAPTSASLAAAALVGGGLPERLAPVGCAVRDAINDYDSGARATVGTYLEDRVSRIVASLAVGDHLSALDATDLLP